MSSGLSSPMSTNRSGDARFSEYSLQISRTEVGRDKDLFFTFRISSQQASILTIPCPAVAARCSFQSLSSDTLLSASVSPSPFSQLQNRHGPLLCLRHSFLSFLKGALFPKFHQDGPACNGDQGGCSNSQKTSASYIRIDALGLMF